MDGQRFDQLARSFAKGASRRGVLKGLIGGAIGGAFTELRTQTARAQCSWSGTFEAPFGGGISMTLNETGGQVNGNYTFTQDNVVRNGSITGIVTTEYPGYTVLDGYWREPGEGGRLWFVMPLDTCGQFTGSYTGTDFSAEWLSGWDGVRTGSESPVGDVKLTFFTNPGDSAVAGVTENRESFTFIGSRDAEGLVERITHVVADAADGDPLKQVVLNFADDGTLVRGALGSGETMLFDWVSPTRIIVTYRSADGSQEVQVPVDAQEDVTSSTALVAGDAGLLAYSSHVNLISILAESDVRLQNAPTWREGTIKVQCSGGAPVRDAIVNGSYWKIGGPRPMYPGEYSLNFVSTTPGVFIYRLPLAPAPATPPPSGTSSAAFWTAVEIICIANTSAELGYMFEGAICSKVAAAATAIGGPIGTGVAGLSCAAIMYIYNRFCGGAKVSWPGSSVIDYSDNYSQAYEVYAYALNYGGYDKRITVTVTPAEIPVGVIDVGGEGSISVSTDRDPLPNEGYTILVATDCAPNGATLTVDVVGTDNWTLNPTHSVTISDTLTSTTVSIPGGGASVQDSITAKLTAFGQVKSVVNKQITF